MYTTTTTKFVLIDIKGYWVNPYLIAAIDVWRSYTDTDSDLAGSRIILADTTNNNVIHCEGITPSEVVEIIRAAINNGGER